MYEVVYIYEKMACNKFLLDVQNSTPEETFIKLLHALSSKKYEKGQIATGSDAKFIITSL